MYHFKTNLPLASIFNNTYIPITLLIVTVTHLERASYGPSLRFRASLFSSVHYFILAMSKTVLPGHY